MVVKTNRNYLRNKNRQCITYNKKHRAESVKYERHSI